MTAERLFAISDNGRRYELVEGELRVMSPAGNLHGRIAMRVGSSIEQHVRAHKLGVVFAAETGFLLARDPDTVRAPDAAFVSTERFAPHADAEGYLPLAPDLAVEVVSPNDTFSQVEEKALAWLDAGSFLVLVVDPGTRTVHVYRAKDKIAVLDEHDELDATDVVPGWKPSVGELFE